MSNENPDPIDVHVGKRLKLRRTMVGMSQEKLGELLGVTFQQIQKYERGTNRMGSSRLFAIGRILATPVAWFFEEIEDAPPVEQDRYALAEERSGFRYESVPAPRDARGEHMASREVLELVRAFNRIDDAAIRRRFCELGKALAELPPARSAGKDTYRRGAEGDWSLPRPVRTS